MKGTMDDESYKTIIIIMALIAVLPFTLMYAIGPFTVMHIYPIVFGLITRKKVQVNPIDYPDLDIAKKITKKKNYYKKLIHLTSLLLTGILLYIGFMITHIYSIIRLIQYGDEVLSSYNDKSHPLPIIHALISSTVNAGGFILFATILAIRISKSRKHDAQSNPRVTEATTTTGSPRHGETHWPAMLAAALISVNISYVGCYFMPYMLLAFIHDPLLTIFTYIMVVLFIACVYLMCQGLWHLCKFCKKSQENKTKNIASGDTLNSNTSGTASGDTLNSNTSGTASGDTLNSNTSGEHNNNKIIPKLFDTLLYSYMLWAIASSVIIFLFVIIYVITMGSFDDFQELQNLTPSILIAVFGLFLLKPAFRFTKKKFKDDEFIHNNRNNRNVARGGRNRDEEERANEEEGQNDREEERQEEREEERQEDREEERQEDREEERQEDREEERQEEREEDEDSEGRQRDNDQSQLI